MNIIEIRGLSKVYGKAHAKIFALKNVELEVAKGDFIAIMGPSGSGKSTLMNILGCLDRQTAGKYYLSGIDICMLNNDEAAAIRNKYIGFIFQSFHLLPKLNVYENIELPMLYAGVSASKRRRIVNEISERLGLGERLLHMPCELSGGQCQRAAIARALVNEPKLILADEPTGNLDSKNSEEIVTLISELNRNRGTSVVLITHERDVAKAADRVLFLKDGAFVQQGENAI